MSGQSETIVYRSVPEDAYNSIMDNNRMLTSLMKRIEAGTKRYLTADEAAIYIGRSRDHLMKNLKDKIGYSMPDGNYAFDIEDIIAYMEKNKRKPNP